MQRITCAHYSAFILTHHLLMRMLRNQRTVVLRVFQTALVEILVIGFTASVFVVLSLVLRLAKAILVVLA